MALRTAFSFPARSPSWFAGHMARSLRELPALLDEVDLVLEARDARLPLTSVNPAFDSMLEHVWGHAGAGADRRGRRKEKIVVYTKRDLAESRYEAPLRKAFWDLGRQRVLFTDSRVDSDVRDVLRVAARTAGAHADAGTATDLKVLVVGMPNVGKSSLLNALRRVGVRRGKAFNTGAEPGVTRRLTGTVRVYDKPPIYVFDTPGVMVPYLGAGETGAERGLKLALTAGIKDGLFEPDTVADYLLYKLNLRLAAEAAAALPDAQRHACYTSRLPLRDEFERTDDLATLLDALAARLGALRKGGERDTDAAQAFLIRQFREGKLGQWTLDDVDGAEEAFLARTKPKVQPTIAVSEMGAVGVHHDVPEQSAEGQSVDGAAPETELPLGARVTRTVAAFLQQAAQERADADAGRNLSISQKRKADLRAKTEYRLARDKARGFDKRPDQRPGQQRRRGRR